MTIIHELKTFIRQHIENLRYLFTHAKHAKYCIEEIDTKAQEVTIRCHGTDTAIKFTYTSIISDPLVLDGLSPDQACLIGGYVGRVIRGDGSVINYHANQKSFLLNKKIGRYRIVYQDRSGQVAYIDTISKKKYLEHPITIVNTRHIILKFNSSQACYLGILAGVSIEKNMQIDKKTGSKKLLKISQKRAKLRIVQ